MDNLKKPEVAISATTAVTLVATILYYNNRIKKLEEKIYSLENNLVLIGHAVDNMSASIKKCESLSKTTSDLKVKQSSQNKKIVELKTSNEEVKETLEKVIEQINAISDKKIKFPNYGYRKKNKTSKKYIESSDEDENSDGSNSEIDDVEEIIKTKKSRK